MDKVWLLYLLLKTKKQPPPIAVKVFRTYEAGENYVLTNLSTKIMVPNGSCPMWKNDRGDLAWLKETEVIG